MDIPYYEYIYDFPGDYDHHHHKHHKPHIQLTHALEVLKVVNLFDAIGNIRYIVKLCSTKIDDVFGYKVKVILFYPNEQPDVNNPLFVIPADPDTYEFDYNKAQNDFDTCVQRYDALLKAETKDFRDIDIYAEKIGYVDTTPECCRFCKWCQKNEYDGHYECHNIKNQRQYVFMNDYPKHHKTHRIDSWQKLPWQKCNPLCGDNYDRDKVNVIFPKVDEFGKCKNFEKIDDDSSQNNEEQSQSEG